MLIKTFLIYLLLPQIHKKEISPEERYHIYLTRYYSYMDLFEYQE